MRYIFLSPHLDDISLSCGGIVNFLNNQNVKTEIWTFFAGIPDTHQLTPFAQSLHDRWQLSYDAPKTRREEDIQACSILGANYRHFDFLDCIYRVDNQGNPIITKEEDLYQDLPHSQDKLVFEINNLIKTSLKKGDILISPLAIGNHVDHQIIYQSIINLDANMVLFYEDYPYVIRSQVNQGLYKQLTAIEFNLEPENLDNWHKSIAAYTSQISTFWKSIENMRSEIIDFHNKGGGKNLWKSNFQEYF